MPVVDRRPAWTAYDLCLQGRELHLRATEADTLAASRCSPARSISILITPPPTHGRLIPCSAALPFFGVKRAAVPRPPSRWNLLATVWSLNRNRQFASPVSPFVLLLNGRVGGGAGVRASLSDCESLRTGSTPQLWRGLGCMPATQWRESARSVLQSHLTHFIHRAGGRSSDARFCWPVGPKRHFPNCGGVPARLPDYGFCHQVLAAAAAENRAAGRSPRGGASSAEHQSWTVSAHHHRYAVLSRSCCTEAFPGRLSWRAGMVEGMTSIAIFFARLWRK